MGFLGLIPTSVWVGLGAFVVASLALFAIDRSAYNRGAGAVQVKWDAERVEMKAALEREKARQSKVVEKTVIEYRDRVKVVMEKGNEIVKAIPYYVRSSCALPPSWRVLHDSAATGNGLPDDPERAIAAAQPVESVAAIETVADNYATCRSDQARLAALQQLVRGLAQ